MTTRPTQPSMGEGHSRFEGDKQHGWSPDIDEEHQEPNDSAGKSFDPDAAPPPGPGREYAKEEDREVPGDTVKSTSRRGEDHGTGTGTYDTGPQGPSRRPSGGRTADAHTGVDPKEPATDTPTSAH
ncbi:hypothetical protein [Kitasatospora sp. MBT63]|uniref:hypothetical protein n=1 Tax=Kitasatospora sp. MBT63 TaxID=1444768 RepID=UPI00053A459D|nr:hypothetical protein [Kitasatospora sp. MBT63]